MSLNVLIVEDSTVMRKMVLRALKMSGLPLADVHEAGSGLDALDVLEKTTIDLAMLDINMPGMNGIQLLEHLRQTEETRVLPVVVVSTEGSDARIQHIRSLGASFVRKPFTPERIIEAVGEALGGGDEHG